MQALSPQNKTLYIIYRMIYRLAITINQQGTREGWLREVAEWLQARDEVIRMVAAEEVGETGTKHLQVSAECTVQEGAMRNRIHDRWMELRGEKNKKGQKMSCTKMRKLWVRNVAYCCKDDGPRYLKDVTQEQLEQWIDDGKEDAKKNKRDTKTWNQQLLEACREQHAVTEDDIGRVIINEYLKIKKTIPDNFQLARQIQTIELLMKEGHWTQDDLIRHIVTQACQIKNRIL
uniref:Replitron HUH endonuclease domain-containing protein n=1 Tax=Pacific flying fox faeces associated circular DNA molecule-2 TaxID=1796020 RepID=A0A140CTU6_9ZZZZ|nr:hypothetical protein [Pacific flying fox faeces associated circular DNA molecule-2]